MSKPQPSADTFPPRPRVVRQQAVGEETVRIGVPVCGSPRIETQADGDGRVTAIDVHCGCGETLRIVCQYVDAEEPSR